MCWSLPPGEDIDDEVQKLADADADEPTERQKRELLKIHRGLGHPQPSELGRALRNVGVKRNLIRWATQEMRCPVCEARVKPLARRPATLPRTLQFNQVVGVDLVELKELGLDIVLCNCVCWGTGYQMMSIQHNKQSQTTRDTNYLRRQCPTCLDWFHACCWGSHSCPVATDRSTRSPPQVIFTNVSSFLQGVRYETRREQTRHDVCFQNCDNGSQRSMFAGLLRILHQTGHAESRGPGHRDR